MEFLLPAAAVAVVLAAGCSSGRHLSAETASTPKATPSSAPSTTPVGSIVHDSAVAECSKFLPVARKLLRVTQDESTVGEMAGALKASGRTWAQGLKRAEHVLAGVPIGGNAARIVALDVSSAVLQLDGANLLAAIGQDSRIPAQWTKVLHALTKTVRKCNRL